MVFICKPNLADHSVDVGHGKISWGNNMIGTMVSELSTLYDEYKIKHVTMTMWLAEPDQFTEANYKTVRVVKSYDTDAEDRHYATESDHYKVSKWHEFFMLPNKKYLFRLSPKWGTYAVSNMATYHT